MTSPRTTTPATTTLTTAPTTAPSAISALPAASRRGLAALAALVALPLAGCAGLLAQHTLTTAEIDAAREQCFYAYAEPATAPNPRANAAVRRWYASLTPAIVDKLTAGGSIPEIQNRIMKHATAAGVGEGDFLDGQHPDPAPACQLGWSHTDDGDNRFANARMAVMSLRWRNAFAACSARFDAVWPQLRAAADRASVALDQLPASADVYEVWSAYHRAMAEHAAAVPDDPEARSAPVFAQVGTPYIVLMDLVRRFAGTDHWFLAQQWIGGVSPLPDGARELVQPAEAMVADARFHYCAQVMQTDSPLSTEQVERLTRKFDNQAWLEEQPDGRALHKQWSARDLGPGRFVDWGAGRRSEDKETFRLYSRPVSALHLTRGAGTVELSRTETKKYRFDCKDVIKVEHEADGSSSISRDDKCKIDTRTETDALTLKVDRLPAGLSLAVGDQLTFYARRTGSDHADGGKPTGAGRTSFSSDIATADLVFVAQVRRGDTVIFPAPAYVSVSR